MSGELEKAILMNTVSGEDVAVLFNPTEYAMERSTTFAALQIPGREAPILQFVAGDNRTLTMELFLDSREHVGPTQAPVVEAQADIRDEVQKITDLMNVQGESHAPPPLLFTWGSLTFSCVLTKVGQKYTLFLPSGIPIRARLTCTFAEFRNSDLEAREVKRETADYTKQHIVVEGDSLPSLSAKEYGAPAMWRVIAVANGIDRPRELTPGDALRIPRLPFLDRLTGRLYE